MQLAGSNALTHSIDGNENFDLPFVPHFSVVGLAPHGHFDLGGCGNVEGCLFLPVSKRSMTEVGGACVGKGCERG